jgi:hypothetical protein
MAGREVGVLRFPVMEYDKDKVDEMVLALPFLTTFDETAWSESLERI